MKKSNYKLRNIFIIANSILLITLIALLVFQHQLEMSKKITIHKNSNFGIKYMIGSNDSDLTSELKPGTFEYYGYISPLNKTTVIINSEGFRDHEYPVEKRNGTYRIAVIGDSFTFGQGVESEDTYPKQLESLLNNGMIDGNYEVMNFGVISYNTFQEVKFLKNKALKYNPDLVIVGYLSNDIIDEKIYFRVLKEIMLKRYNTTDGSNITNNVSVHREIFDTIYAEIDSKPFNETWAHVENSFSELNNMSKENNFSVAVFMLPAEGDYFKEQVEMLNKTCAARGWLFIYPKDTYSAKKINSMILDKYDTHPTPEAYSIMAEEIYSAIKPIVQSG
jgi:lysophospholipase L1-like esterase